jgi:hypothetical protein
VFARVRAKGQEFRKFRTNVEFSEWMRDRTHRDSRSACDIPVTRPLEPS